MARLLFFGKLVDVAGARTRNWPLGDAEITVNGLLSLIERNDTTLGAALSDQSVRFIVNEMMATGETTISDEDEIAFLPPVSGG